MSDRPLFGEWLAAPVRGVALRMVLEEMSERSPHASVAAVQVETDPQMDLGLAVSSGVSTWPWQAEPGDVSPALTWTAPEPVEFRSLGVEQTSESVWVRRYRVEVSPDGEHWEVATPSTVIDAYHRQPCRLENRMEALESSLLPPGRGTQWVQSYFSDYLLKSIELIGPEHPYPDWLSGEYFLAAAVRPFGFGGVYNSGDAGNFDALIAALYCPEMAWEGQRLFPDLIGRFGFMPGVMDPGHKDDQAFALDYSGTTWGPCCYYDLFNWTQDRDSLTWFADACATWARWWLDNRDRNADGWLEPGVNACRPSAEVWREEQKRRHPTLAAACPEFWDYWGLQRQDVSAFHLSVFEEPWDDGHFFVRGRHRAMRFDPQTCSLNVHFIETQCYISLLCGFVDYAYRLLGRDAQAGHFRAEAERLAGLVQDNCWDESTGFYYDRDAETGALRTFAKHAGAFVPMFMGLCTTEQAAQMVAHLTNPEEFWTELPVPVISRDTPDYSPQGYWSGRAWPPTNFFVLRALLSYGYLDIADELLRRWLAVTAACAEPTARYFTVDDWDWREPPMDMRHVRVPDVTWIVPENWNPETGAVYASGGLGWGGLWLPAVIMRSFWPVGAEEVLLRPGGHFRLQWGSQWKVRVVEDRAWVNGRSVRLPEPATYLLNTATGALELLPRGQADPVVLARRPLP